jgi:hypothetical protein
MFPRLRERLGSALDLVVELSTLGEYRLDALPGTSSAEGAQPAAARPAPGLGGAGRTSGVFPAAGPTGTSVATASVPRATPAARRVAARARGGHATRVGQGRRTRDGAVEPPEQACLFRL